jgi:hypothetical protein
MLPLDYSYYTLILINMPGNSTRSSSYSEFTDTAHIQGHQQ